MSRIKSLRHKIHKYRKALLGKMIIYRCILPDCSHYLRRELVVGHMSLCHKCNEPFLLPQAPSQLKAMPWCPTCEDTRKKDSKFDVEVPAEILAKLGGL